MPLMDARGNHRPVSALESHPPALRLEWKTTDHRIPELSPHPPPHTESSPVLRGLWEEKVSGLHSSSTKNHCHQPACQQVTLVGGDWELPGKQRKSSDEK